MHLVLAGCDRVLPARDGDVLGVDLVEGPVLLIAVVTTDSGVRPPISWFVR